MEKAKVTKRDYFNAIRKYVNGEDAELAYPVEDVVAFIDTAIAQIDTKAEKEKARAAEKKAEGDALRETVLAAVTDEFATVDVILDRVYDATNDEEITKSKVVARLTQLVKAGTVVKEESKELKKMVYKLA